MFSAEQIVVVEDDPGEKWPAAVLFIDGAWVVFIRPGLDGETRQSILNMAAYRARTGRPGWVELEVAVRNAWREEGGNPRP